MNKSQIILAAVGGTAVVGALVLGYFIWDASDVKSENSETLEGNIASARRIMEKLPVKPENAALSVYSDNCAAYDEWRAEAKKIAERGDLVFESTTPAEFKTTIVGEARKIALLAGCFDGKIVKPDFGFGFKDYVTGGAMPPEKDLKRLQREWNDVAFVLRTIAACCSNGVGIAEVRMGKAKAAAVEEEQPQPVKKGKAKKKAKKAKVEEETPADMAVTSFAVDFLARPSGLVKTLNAFATDTRFVVVESCTFSRERDEIAEALGADGKKSEQQSARSNRRSRKQPSAAANAEAAKSGVVTDPATAPMLKVTMTVSVYDFGTLEKQDGGEKVNGAEEGEQK